MVVTAVSGVANCASANPFRSSTIQRVGKIGQAVRGPVPVLRGGEIGGGTAAIFLRTVDEGGEQAAASGGGEVAVVGGDEAELGGCEVQRGGGAEIGGGVGLVARG